MIDKAKKNVTHILLLALKFFRRKDHPLESTYQLYGKHPENPNNQLVDTPEHFTRAP